MKANSLLCRTIVELKKIMTKYQSVIDDIKDRILNGVWPPGSLMPGEIELCRLYGVSRITVRRALEELSASGFTRRVQGKGTFSASPVKLQSGSSRLGFSEYMRELGIEVTSELYADEEIAADETVRKKLLFHDEEKNAWHFMRVRKADGVPIAVMDTYVSVATGRLMHDYDLERESFFGLYRKISGEEIGRNITTLSAVNPPKRITDLLKMPKGAAGILLESTAYLADGRPAQYDVSIFNPAYYRFTASDGFITESAAK